LWEEIGGDEIGTSDMVAVEEEGDLDVDAVEASLAVD
jgi:hypothetical protein